MSRNLKVAAAQLGPIARNESRQAVVKRLIDLMREAARSADRDPSQIEVTTAASLDPGFIETLAAQGIGRVLVSPPTGDLDALPKALESFRKNVMEAHPEP